jgi:hypothetical protein
MSFSKATEKFCTLIFHLSSSGLFRNISRKYLLGLSPASESSTTFKLHWNKALFREALMNGLQLLNNIDVEHMDYLPEW